MFSAGQLVGNLLNTVAAEVGRTGVRTRQIDFKYTLYAWPAKLAFGAGGLVSDKTMAWAPSS